MLVSVSICPLCNHDESLTQVSFPGGHIEQDETPIEAALRETREEMGEEVGPIKVLGTCQRLPAGACVGAKETLILCMVLLYAELRKLGESSLWGSPCL